MSQSDLPFPISGFPVVSLTPNKPMEDYFQSGTSYWSVARLYALAEKLPVFECPLAALELGHRIWSDCNVIELAQHCARVIDSDLDSPILLDWAGGIADGRHRVIKALMQGKTSIKAKRLMVAPKACRVD